MKITSRLLCLALVPLAAGGVLLAARGPVEPAARARAILATVSVDGAVVLRAGTSDDGHADADEVWGYLRRLDLHPTEAFAKLGIEAGEKSVTLGWLKSAANAHRGAPPALELSITYGGLDDPFRLGLVRAEEPGLWRVAAETVERRFAHRRITRREAALLERPGRER
ncbi:MAG: hypothetical protein AAF682_11365 [Planctomycetota bacterium]